MVEENLAMKNVKLWPIQIAGCQLKSVENNLQNILNDLENKDEEYLGQNGSCSIEQNLLENSFYNEIKKEVLFYVNQYRKQLGHNVKNLKIVSSWSNKVEKGENIDWHTHENSYISGVIHLTKGSDLLLQRPYIKTFFQIATPYQDDEEAAIIIPPKAGQLVLFPSALIHGVDNNNSNEARFSIAFNTWPTEYGFSTSKVNLNNQNT